MSPTLNLNPNLIVSFYSRLKPMFLLHIKSHILYKWGAVDFSCFFLLADSAKANVQPHVHPTTSQTFPTISWLHTSPCCPLSFSILCLHFPLLNSYTVFKQRFLYWVCSESPAEETDLSVSFIFPCTLILGSCHYRLQCWSRRTILSAEF